MSSPTKYFITSTSGFFINWHITTPGLETKGQSLEIKGSIGNDEIFVGLGTVVDATKMTSTSGNDAIYLIGKLSDYETSHVGSQYTVFRTVDGALESVTFFASTGDTLYFADGSINISPDNLKITGTSDFKNLRDITPTGKNTPDTLADISVIKTPTSPTKVFITDINSTHINSGITGSSFEIKGSIGDDTVYVALGTIVDATKMTSTSGNDAIYLTGNFQDYTNTHSGSQYTFTKTVNLSVDGVDYIESVTFFASTKDKLYFANGFVNIGGDDLRVNGAFVDITDGTNGTTDMLDEDATTPGLGIALTITDDKAATVKSGETIAYTFTFDKPVTGFDLTDITVKDDDISRNNENAKGIFTAVTGENGVTNGTKYTLVVTPKANFEGNLVITVAKDAATSGNVKTLAASTTQVIDTKSPDAPTDLKLLTTDDTGTNTTDNLTNKTTVTITGKAEANSTVELFNTTTSLGTVTANDSGTFSKEVTLPENATANITAKATDTAGNPPSPASTPTLSVVVDTTAPTFTSGISTEIVTGYNITAVVYTAAATDTHTVTYSLKTANNAKFELTNDGALKYKTAPEKGTDTVTIIATDTAGNTSEQIVTISVIEPRISTSIAWNNINDDNIINATEITTATLSGTTNTTGVTGATITSIVFTEVDDTNNKITISDSSNLPTITSNTWTLANDKFASELSEGKSYTVEVNLSGTANGNPITNTVTHTTPVLIDKISNAPEDLKLATADDTGISDTDGITNKTTVTITGKAEANSTVELFNGTTSLGTVTTNDSGTFRKEVDLTANTTANIITAKATDTAGNPLSTASTSLSVVVDTTGPTFTSSTSAEIKTDSAVTTVVYTATTTDTNTVTYSLKAGENDDADKFNITNGELKYNSKQDSKVTHTVTIIATDAAGNISEQEVTVSVKDTFINTSIKWDDIGDDNIANDAELTFVTLSGTVNIAGVTGVTISSIVFTEVGTGTKITIGDSDGSDSSNIPTITSSNTWILARDKFTSLLTNGESYTVEVNLSGTASDSTPITGKGTYTTPVLIDTTSAATPTNLQLLTTDDADGNKVVNKRTVTITGEAEAGATVELFATPTTTSTTTSLGTVTVDSAGKFSRSVTLLANTATNITAKATDIAGNPASSATPTPLVVTVDTTAPVIGDVTFSWGDYLKDTTATNTIKIKIADTNISNQQLTLTIGTGTNTKSYSAIVANDEATFTIRAIDLTNLKGEVTYTININDRAGNPAPTKTGTFIIDTTPATITGTLFTNTGITITDHSGLGGLTANFTVNDFTASHFTLTPTADITLDTNNNNIISYKGTVVTTTATNLTPGINAKLTLAFTDNATDEAINAVINAITYEGAAQDITLTTKDRDNNESTATLAAANVPNTAYLAYTTPTFTEAADNTGKINGTMTITLSNDTFKSTLTQNTDYTVTNIPAGLTLALTVNDDAKTATATFTGTATNHLKTNNLTNIGITFKKEAFTTTQLPHPTTISKTDIPITFIEVNAPTITESTTGTSLIGKAITIAIADNTYDGLIVNFSATDNAKATFAITDSPSGTDTNIAIAYDTTNKAISYGGIQVATVDTTNGITLTFNTAATQPAVNAIANAITATHDGGIAQAITLTATDAKSQSSNTFIQGTAAADTITAPSAQDTTIKGGEGYNKLTGGAGNDTLIGGAGYDDLTGGAGNDILRGGANSDTLIGGAGDDTLIAGQGYDTLIGGAGNDILISNKNSTIGTNFDFNIQFKGGAGNDIFDFNVANGDSRFSQEDIDDFTLGEDRIDLKDIFKVAAGIITANTENTVSNLNKYIFATTSSGNSSDKFVLLYVNKEGNTSMIDAEKAREVADMKISIKSGDGTSAAALAGKFNDNDFSEYIFTDQVL